MKSKRAEKYIEEHRDKHPYPSGDFSSGAAFEAVELAEEDMAEKAAKAFCFCKCGVGPCIMKQVGRDCTIWDDFCRENGIEYRMMAPCRGCTKLDASKFKALTKWQGRTTEHSRDAAMIVFGR